MDNLELWDKVWTTTKDTKTKEVSYWARKFTAIDAYSQIKTATKEFGKYWEKWGFRAIDYNITEWRIYFIWTFFYPNGAFPIFNDQKVWDDWAKKVFTDSLTKALSYLWFNADVFMGQFSWNKYTGDSKKEETNDDLPWIAQTNIDKLTDLIADWKKFTYSDIKKKYKISKANRTKLEAMGIK